MSSIKYKRMSSSYIPLRMKLGIAANPIRKHDFVHSAHSPNLSGFFLIRCGHRRISALFGGGSTLTFMGMVGGDNLAGMTSGDIGMLVL